MIRAAALMLVAATAASAKDDGMHHAIGSFEVITKAGVADLQVTIAPDSGFGALAGVAGTLTMNQSHGGHRYDLAYTLSATA